MSFNWSQRIWNWKWNKHLLCPNYRDLDENNGCWTCSQSTINIMAIFDVLIRSILLTRVLFLYRDIFPADFCGSEWFRRIVQRICTTLVLSKETKVKRYWRQKTIVQAGIRNKAGSKVWITHLIATDFNFFNGIM